MSLHWTAQNSLEDKHEREVEKRYEEAIRRMRADAFTRDQLSNFAKEITK